MTHFPDHSESYPRASSVAVACLLGLLLLASGCQHVTSCYHPFANRFFGHHQQVESPQPAPPTYSLFVSPLFQANPPRRVVMIEGGPTAGNYNESRKMISELSTQIRSTGAFEIIAPPNARLRSQMDNILQGKFDEREVVEISRRFNADAVAFVRVNELKGHAAMRTSVTMAIVDTNETVVVFAIDGIWDTANMATQTEFQNHVNAQSHLVPSPMELQFHSPVALFSFVASQMARAIQESVF